MGCCLEKEVTVPGSVLERVWLQKMRKQQEIHKRIALSEPHLAGREWEYVKECLDTAWVSSAGRFVDAFESAMAQYVGVPHAVACVNGTAALHTALLVSGVCPGDEVIVPTLTFIAPVNAVRYTGAHPVFMDCDEYLNMDVLKLETFFRKECRRKGKVLVNKKTGRRVRAVIPVHIFGHLCRMDVIAALAREFGLFVIEDSTESLGSIFSSGTLKGKHSGSVGDIGCFSYNGNKIITTGGGGMMAIRNAALAKRARYLTTQAKDDGCRYIHYEVGYNYRMTNVQAAIGLAQLEQLDGFVDIKRKNFQVWQKELSGIPGLSLIGEPPYGKSNYWFYSLVIDRKIFGCHPLDLMKVLAAEAIEARPVWELNHRQRPYRSCEAYRIRQAPKWHRSVLNIPCSVTLTQKDIHRIAEVIRDYARK